MITIPCEGIDVGRTLRPLAMLSGDPTTRIGAGVFERATLTPQGSGSLRLRWSGGRVSAEVFGDGAEWLAARLGALVGADDDPSGFRPTDRVVGALWSRHPGIRVGRTGTVWHDLLWTVAQQRIRRVDAIRQWRVLVQQAGVPAPGIDGLLAPPTPEAVTALPSYELRRMGFDIHRARAMKASASVAHRLVGLIDVPWAQARRALATIPGIGPWTIACLSAFTWGDADTVIVGDSGIPSMIAQTLAGERWADDARMLELLEPYRPHRYRVLRLAFAAHMR
jgi:3-methyladenine DNA glycosylase/8-oxoguanine DNA glycosylase